MGDAYCDHSENLHILDNDTDITLRARIFSAVARSKRFFETAIEQTHDGSFWNIGKQIAKSSKVDFIRLSKAIGDLAASAHTRKKTPGGLLIVVDAEIDKKPAVIVVKAELQEALTLNGSTVEIMKELFLSPAKDFYKIGILIHDKVTNSNHNAYRSFVYDDQFTAQKDDLAVYFYKDFLGFTTSENDKLLTKNFLADFTGFIDNNVNDHETRKNIKVRIKADYRESSNDVLDPSSYIEFFPKQNPLHEKFQKQIIEKYNQSFTKDLTLVDGSLQKGSLHLVTGARVVGDSDVLDSRIEIVDDLGDPAKREKLKATIDSGNISKVVTVASLPEIEL